MLLCAVFAFGDEASNPSAVEIYTGTGELGQWLGFEKDSGVRIGALWIGDLNYLIAGGKTPHKMSGNNLAQVSLHVGTEKGGLFGAEFLQFNGRPTNIEAGSVQGYNSLTGSKPLDRSELYQLWYRQVLFNGKVIIRIGKSIPNYDFNNVIKPHGMKGVSATTSLTYTPIYVNTTMLGVLPGYYNSAYGVTVMVVPSESFYLSYGGYDGNLARGKQTGLRGPQFNGYYFHIAEVGIGNISFGGWYQSGKREWGLYAFGAQELSCGIIGFFQAGANDSKSLPMTRYFGAGLTFIDWTRPKDSFGFGVAASKLRRRNEVILQSYYQMYLFEGGYWESALSYIKNRSYAMAATSRLIVLF